MILKRVTLVYRVDKTVLTHNNRGINVLRAINLHSIANVAVKRSKTSKSAPITDDL